MDNLCSDESSTPALSAVAICSFVGNANGISGDGISGVVSGHRRRQAATAPRSVFDKIEKNGVRDA